MDRVRSAGEPNAYPRLLPVLTRPIRWDVIAERLARFRVGCKGRISHMKRGYHAGRSRREATGAPASGSHGQVLSYDVDTVARL
jgi:hypothetical protein